MIAVVGQRFQVHLHFVESGKGMKEKNIRSKEIFAESSFLREDRGSSLVELLSSLVIMSILFTMSSAMYITTVGDSLTNQQSTTARAEARALLDHLSFNARMLGAGLPMGQDEFPPGDPALGDAPFPVFVDSSKSLLHFRSNERGVSSVLTQDFTPSATSLDIDLLSVDKLRVGDTVYLSGMLAGEESAMQAEIAAISGNTITIDGAYVALPGVTFPVGSQIHQVREISYESFSDWSGVARTLDGNSEVLVPNSIFTVEYLDALGNTMSVPLSQVDILNTLSAVRISVSVAVENPISNPSAVVATAEQVVSLRNLTLNR